MKAIATPPPMNTNAGHEKGEPWGPAFFLMTMRFGVILLENHA